MFIMSLAGATQVGDHNAVTERLNAVFILHGSRQTKVSSADAVSSLILIPSLTVTDMF